MATVSFSLTTGTTPSPKQALEGALGVAVGLAPHDVVGGEQDLPHRAAVAGEGLGVGAGEVQLPDTRGGLLRREVPRPARQPERTQARRDRPGGHEHDLGAGRAGGHGVDERVEAPHVEPAVDRRQRRRPDLHHQPPRPGDGLAGSHRSSARRSAGTSS